MFKICFLQLQLFYSPHTRGWGGYSQLEIIFGLGKGFFIFLESSWIGSVVEN